MIVIGQVPLGIPSLEVTVNPASPQASVTVKPVARKYANVWVGTTRAVMSQPSVAIGVNVPVIAGAVLSFMVMVCVAVVAFRQASVTVYVLMTVIGQVPLAAPSLEVTVSPASPQASVTVKPVARKYANVWVGTTRAVMSQPSVAIGVNVPVIAGAVLSFMVMVGVGVVELRHLSVTVYVLMTVIGQVPLAAPSLEVTVNPASPQASVTVKPVARKYANVWVGTTRAVMSQPSVAIGVNVPVIAGAVLSFMVMVCVCLLYTSDAADDLLCVDL